MLTALEVHGFKSFADKTRFDFPAGMTVIVGPNGSGKSNVVDALKWVLGTQSAKSLRGSEMTDVIFKGSSTGRKPLNTAEASLVFDNSDSRLPVEEKQVKVTRRVYRSGEGEYLINGQPCRLRDIKDMFRGTGVGADAYSIIEQGKVSGMLQASAKDRRAIFEEAAGISRFKAKKVETERRLARVDQNMLRLSDIVDEVESRLRSVRSQAGKARRYKEYSDRLQELRTQVGFADWRKLTDRLNELQRQQDDLQAELAAAEADCETQQKQLAETEVESREIDRDIRQTEGLVAANRERIAAGQSTVEHQRARCLELEEEITRCRRQLAAMSHRTGNLDEQLRQTNSDVADADEEYARLSQRVVQIVEDVERVGKQLGETRDAENDLIAQRVTLAQKHAQSTSNLESARQQFATEESLIQSGQASQQEVSAKLEEVLRASAEAESLLRTCESNEQQCARQVQAARDDAARMRRLAERCRDELANVQSEQVRLHERATMLTDLVQRQEGVRSGTQEILSRAQSSSSGPFADVCGMLADLIDVPVESAQVVEAALGEMAQAIIVRSHDLVDYFRESARRPRGRVAIVPLEDAPLSIETQWSAFEQQQGVVGRADRFVHCELVYTPLVRRLLGTTWVVESLEVAEHLSEIAGGGARFVTLDGAVLEVDGTWIFGAGQQATSLISRRSELRQVQQRQRQIQTEIENARNKQAAAKANAEECEAALKQAEVQQREAQDEAAKQQAAVESLQQELDRHESRLTELKQELSGAQQRRMDVEKSIALGKTRVQVDAEAMTSCDEQLETAAIEIRRLEAQQKACEIRATTAKVDAAKSEERLDALRARQRQLQRDRQERQRALEELNQQIAGANARLLESELAILSNQSLVAQWFLDRERLDVETASHDAQRDQLAARRRAINAELDACRKTVHRLEEKRHRLEMSVEQTRSERDHLAGRLRDDYGIELAELTHDETEEELSQREAAEEEINELRRKINNIGAVNLEALNEIDDLEVRFNDLAGQYNDLKESKEALEKIIQRINTDSRRLFSETLEAIRENFQRLYRKLFGGGHADLVLEEGVDILEAGIEIVANPPGKPAFSNSLLSGGEQGLTAVSLLLAIFQHRPSPFCVLDEVDAPLDESNIGRFVDVLHEFLDWTKFVIVTHSKKTMTAANTLYGVTMQEPNVSKRVSVQFDDVSDKGEISADAVARSEDDDDERGAA